MADDRTLHFEANLVPIESFFGLLDNVVIRGIYNHFNFLEPFGFQKHALGPILDGNDVILEGPAGSGKTSAMAMALCQIVNSIPSPSGSGARALVLLPTRKLVCQTAELISAIGEQTKIPTCNLDELRKKLKTRGLVPGEDRKKKKVNQGIVLGTPRSIADMIQRRLLRTRSIKLLVLDRCDKMLRRGYKDEILELWRCLPKKPQLVISTRHPAGIPEITEFMGRAGSILIRANRQESIMEGIRHHFVDVVKEKYKYGALQGLYGGRYIHRAVVFCNSNRQVNRLGKKMHKDGYSVLVMPGDTPVEVRHRKMEELRSGTTRALITRDKFASELVDQAVTFVINYDLPVRPQQYIHQTGWRGRFWPKVNVINFVLDEDTKKLLDIEKLYDIKIDEMPETSDV